MNASKKIKSEKGIKEAFLMMATESNLEILKGLGMIKKTMKPSPDDLLISIKAETQEYLDNVISKLDSYFKAEAKKEEKESSIKSAAEKINANFVLISLPGRYAAYAAKEALDCGLNVKIFSDNVSLEDEIELKKYAVKKDLFLLGPDAGTSIINGVPLAFSNIVNIGKIGIVGASGTGIQETSVLISKYGSGISQALGVGGRDLSEKVGGLMSKFSLKALDEDKNTNVILFISKIPSQKVVNELIGFIEREIKKPIVVLFIGAELGEIKSKKIHFSSNLFDAAIKSVFLEKGRDPNESQVVLVEKEKNIKEIAKEEMKRKTKKQIYIRGLFSGGTLCEEALLVLKNIVGNIYSNVPLSEKYKLRSIWESKCHTFIDFGSDEFTVSRLHPIIDYELRLHRLLKEVEDETVSVIIMDVILGCGANKDPQKEILSIFQKMSEKAKRTITFIIHLLGTDKDPQNYTRQMKKLKNEGMIITETNYEAALLAGYISKK